VFKRYQHFRYIYPETRAIEGYIQWAAEAEAIPALSPPSAEVKPKNAILQVNANDGQQYQVPRITLESLDRKPLLKAERMKLKIENPKGLSISDSLIKFYWKEKEYSVAPGEYIFLPESVDECLRPI